MFIVIDGPDGSGKSTLAASVANTLAAEGRSAPVGSEEPPGYALEDLEALVKMLLSMFESGEFLRFLRFSSDFAAGVRDLVEWQRNAQVRQVAGVVTRLRGQVKPGAGV